MLLKTKTVGKDGNLTKTAIIPFSSIACIDFETEVNDETAKESNEMCIRFNTNCPDITISDKDVSRICFEIYEEGQDKDGDYGYYDSESIKDFEDLFRKFMCIYIEKTQMNASIIGY